MKIGVLGHYGVGNIGDEAILEGLKFLIKKIRPDAEIVVLGKGNMFPFGVRSFLKSIFLWKKWGVPYMAFKKCDLIIVGGGGLFTEEEFRSAPIFWALQGYAACYLRKPVISLGISVSNLNPLTRFFVKRLLRRIKAIGVRDRSSLNILKQWGVHATLSSDLALSIPQFPHYHHDASYIVLSVRRFKKLEGNLYKIFAQFCDEISVKYGLNIVLLPFQAGAENDRYILNKIYDQCKRKDNVRLENFHPNIAETLSILKGAKAVIAMRLHAGILSLMAGVPFLPIAYMEKISTFFEEFPEIQPVQFHGLSSSNLEHAFEKLWKERSDIASRLQEIRQKLYERNGEIEKILQEYLSII